MNFEQTIRGLLIALAVFGIFKWILENGWLRARVGSGGVRYIPPGALVVTLVLMSYFSHPSTNDQIVELCDIANKKFPMQVSEGIRVDKFIPGNMRIIQTFTILPTFTLSPDLRKEMQAGTSALLKSKPEMKQFLDLGVTFTYRYFDQQKNLIMEFDVSSVSQP